MPDDNAGNNGSPGQQGNTPPAGADNASATWRDALPEDLQGHQALEGIGEPADLAKAYVSALAKVPQVPESYEITPPEGVELHKESLESFSAVCREAGLSNDQAGKIYNYALDQQSVVVQAQAKIREDALAATKAALKKEHGEDYEKAITGAQTVLTHFGGDDLAKVVEDSGLKTNAGFMQFLIKISKFATESGLIDGNSGGGPAERKMIDGQPTLHFNM